MRMTSLAFVAALAAGTFATATPASAQRCVLSTRICVITHCDYNPETGLIYCD